MNASTSAPSAACCPDRSASGSRNRVGAVPAQIRHEHAEARLDEKGDDLDVAVDVVGIAVQQHDRLGGRVAGIDVGDGELARGDRRVGRDAGTWSSFLQPSRRTSGGARRIAAPPASGDDGLRQAGHVRLGRIDDARRRRHPAADTEMACEAPAISRVPRDAARSAPARCTATGMFRSSSPNTNHDGMSFHAGRSRRERLRQRRLGDGSLRRRHQRGLRLRHVRRELVVEARPAGSRTRRRPMPRDTPRARRRACCRARSWTGRRRSGRSRARTRRRRRGRRRTCSRMRPP